MHIEKAGIKDIPLIRNIATTAWTKTYGEILSSEQSMYMLDMMYSDESLSDQMQNGQYFILIRNSTTQEYNGFASIEYHYKRTNKTKIHKLYVLPNKQGGGFGKTLLEYISSLAKKQGDKYITLNMNRFNRSHGFYTKMGFSISGEEDIDIGNGYLMEDYIFEKEI